MLGKAGRPARKTNMDVSPEKPANEEPAKPDPSAPAPDSSAAPPDRSPPEPPPPPPRRAAGVSVLGAARPVLGILLALLGIASLVVSRDNGVSALDARLAGLELDLRELAARAPPASADPKILEEVANRLAKLEAAGRAAPSSGDPALATRIAALETEVKTLAEAVGALARRNEETLAAARAALAELAQKLPDASAAVRSELEGLASRVTGVERGEKAVESGDRAVRLALAASTRRQGATPPRSSRAARPKVRAAIFPARLPRWRSCRRKRARPPRPGSSARRRRPPRVTRAAASPPTRSQNSASDVGAHTSRALHLSPRAGRGRRAKRVG